MCKPLWLLERHRPALAQCQKNKTKWRKLWQGLAQGSPAGNCKCTHAQAAGAGGAVSSSREWRSHCGRWGARLSRRQALPSAPRPPRLAPRRDWLRGGSAPSQGAGPCRLQSGEGHGASRSARAAGSPLLRPAPLAHRLCPETMEGVSALLASCPTAGLAGGLGVTACAAAGVVLYRIARR